MSNYDKILRDKENNLPIEKGSVENHWALLETGLNSASQSSGKKAKFNLKKIVKSLLVTAVIAITIFVSFWVIKNKSTSTSNTNEAVAKSTIKPPMPAVNVPYEIFTYQADKGDTLFTQNGSILIFPKNAVTDNEGKIVTGKVEVRTREFNDPIDFYMAGIPMTYDSAGVKYTFVSSGMIDIKAYQNNELLKVNPYAKPQLNLVSTNNEKNTNLYVLDTATGIWISKGKDVVNDLEMYKQSSKVNKSDLLNDKKNYNALRKGETINKESENDFFSEEINTQIKPIMPEKASGKNATIEIIIDPASFQELLAYNKLKFEVLDRSIETVGEDAKTEWDNVELIHTDAGKGYIAKFSLGQKIIQYKVKPVLEGKNYDDALVVYNDKIKAYYDVQKARVNNEQKQQDTFALQEKKLAEENKRTAASNEVAIAKNKITEIENKRIEELNVLILARNKKIAEDKITYEAFRKLQQKINDSLEIVWQKDSKARAIAMAAKQKINDSLQLIWNRNNRALALNNNLIRSFNIDGFGYWNCDQPTLPSGIPISATFIDDTKKPISFKNINVVSIGINRIFTYYNNNITVNANTNYIIWGVYLNEFYYLTYRDYQKLNINITVTEKTFVLKKYEGDINNIETLKAILYNKT